MQAGATDAGGDLCAQAQAGQVQSLNLILKADVQGSLEPIRNSLEQLEVGDLKVRLYP